MSHTRRTVLRLGGVSALTLGTAGCSSITDSFSGGGGDSTNLQMVPEGVSAVARGDVTATLNDAAVTQFVNETLDMFAQREYYSGPTDKEDLLDQFSDQTGLELSKAKTAVGYIKYPDQDGPDKSYTGFWFEADWKEEDVVEAFEDSNVPLAEDTHNGKTVYEPEKEYQSLWLGVLDSSTYVVGTENAVKDTIEVDTGDMESVGDDLRNAYAKSRSAPFRFASVVPDGSLPSSEMTVGGSSVDPQRFSGITYVSGATYHDTNDDTVGIELKLLTEGESEAKTVKEALVGVVSAAEGTIKNDDLQKSVEEITVERTGSTVVASVSGSVDRATTVIRLLVKQLFGLA